MNDVVVVRVLECGADLTGEFDHLLQIVCRLLAQIGTVDQFHDTERKAVVLTHIVDSDYVWMIQRRSGARFAQKAAARIGSARYACLLPLLLLLILRPTTSG